jgi:N-acetylglucosamine PTS system EIICBA or EIICB component
LVDDSLASEQALRTLGARGIVRSAQNVMQVVLGPQAKIVAGEIRDAMTGKEYAGLLAAAGKSVVAAEGAIVGRQAEAVAAPVDAKLNSR